MGEILFIISLIAGLIIPFMWLQGMGRILWVNTMSLIGLTVVGAEIVGKATTGMTISRHFWTWSLEHPTSAVIVLIALAMGWGSLILHLGWKLLTRKKNGP